MSNFPNILPLTTSSYVAIPASTVPPPQVFVSYHPQKAGSNWCWAACAQMVLATYGKEYDQCRVVEKYFAHFGQTETCCNSTNCDAQELGLPENFTWLYQEDWNIMCTLNSQYVPNGDNAQLSSALAQFFTAATRPLQIHFQPIDTGANHVMLVNGFFTFGATNNLQILDPMGVYSGAKDVDWLLAQGSWLHTWQFAP